MPVRIAIAIAIAMAIAVAIPIPIPARIARCLCLAGVAARFTQAVKPVLGRDELGVELGAPSRMSEVTRPDDGEALARRGGRQRARPAVVARRAREV